MTPGNKRLINLVLMLSIFGVLAFTASEYVSCHDEFPDEFLDLVAAYQNPVLLVFTSQLNVHLYVLKFLKVVHLRKINLLTSILRC